jgi:hypothetical protein
MPPIRRLTAILAADVAGYSRLMGADEEGTHARLKVHLAQLIEPKIKEHRGHTVKNTGDGLLAEFPSVVDAVRCAVEIQRGMAERNAETPEDKRITFRIGVNLGDVIVEEHDIFGPHVVPHGLRPQLVIGLMSAADGCPMAVEVFEGKTADPVTLPVQIDKLGLQLLAQEFRARSGGQRVERAQFAWRSRLYDEFGFLAPATSLRHHDADHRLGAAPILAARHPDKLVLLELWKDQAALDAHAKLQAQRPPLPEGLRLGTGEREDYIYNRAR